MFSGAIRNKQSFSSFFRLKSSDTCCISMILLQFICLLFFCYKTSFFFFVYFFVTRVYTRVYFWSPNSTSVFFFNMMIYNISKLWIWVFSIIAFKWRFWVELNYTTKLSLLIFKEKTLLDPLNMCNYTNSFEFWMILHTNIYKNDKHFYRIWFFCLYYKNVVVLSARN